eukprot:51270-Eustigmatos_ZCMA.PRE.1
MTSDQHRGDLHLISLPLSVLYDVGRLVAVQTAEELTSMSHEQLIDFAGEHEDCADAQLLAT